VRCDYAPMQMYLMPLLLSSVRGRETSTSEGASPGLATCNGYIPPPQCRFEPPLTAWATCYYTGYGRHSPILAPTQQSGTSQSHDIQDSFRAMVSSSNKCTPLTMAQIFLPIPVQTPPVKKRTLSIIQYGEMLMAADRMHFVEAMKKEVDGIADMLEEVPQSSIPPGNKPLPAIWALLVY
jgi:hypothetical protein